ncbi:MAG: hypothetical protein QM606_00245 [Leucobacter sp.]
MLAVSPGGSLIRAVVGSCPEPAGTVTTSSDGGATWEPSPIESFGVTRVLGLSADEGGLTHMVALNADCAPQAVRSFVSGASWQAADDDLASSWYLDPSSPSTAHSPSGDIELPCAALSLSAAGESAVVLCPDRTVSVTGDQGLNWSDAVAVPGAAAVGLSDGGAVIASANETECAGVRTRTLTGGVLSEPGACAETAVADGEVAVAASGDDLYLWAGEAFVHSADAGATWG